MKCRGRGTNNANICNCQQFTAQALLPWWIVPVHFCTSASSRVLGFQYRDCTALVRSHATDAPTMLCIQLPVLPSCPVFFKQKTTKLQIDKAHTIFIVRHARQTHPSRPRSNVKNAPTMLIATYTGPSFHLSCAHIAKSFITSVYTHLHASFFPHQPLPAYESAVICFFSF